MVSISLYSQRVYVDFENLQSVFLTTVFTVSNACWGSLFTFLGCPPKMVFLYFSRDTLGHRASRF
jgi:hypothetical protein